MKRTRIITLEDEQKQLWAEITSEKAKADTFLAQVNEIFEEISRKLKNAEQFQNPVGTLATVKTLRKEIDEKCAEAQPLYQNILRKLVKLHQYESMIGITKRQAVKMTLDTYLNYMNMMGKSKQEQNIVTAAKLQHYADVYRAQQQDELTLKENEDYRNSISKSYNALTEEHLMLRLPYSEEVELLKMNTAYFDGRSYFTNDILSDTPPLIEQDLNSPRKEKKVKTKKSFNGRDPETYSAAKAMAKFHERCREEVQKENDISQKLSISIPE